MRSLLISFVMLSLAFASEVKALSGTISSGCPALASPGPDRERIKLQKMVSNIASFARADLSGLGLCEEPAKTYPFGFNFQNGNDQFWFNRELMAMFESHHDPFTDFNVVRSVSEAVFFRPGESIDDFHAGNLSAMNYAGFVSGINGVTELEIRNIISQLNPSETETSAYLDQEKLAVQSGWEAGSANRPRSWSERAWTYVSSTSSAVKYFGGFAAGFAALLGFYEWLKKRSKG